MKRRQNNRKLKSEILRLRAEGKSYNEIAKELDCSKSVISYHCSPKEGEKTRLKKRNKTIEHKLSRKITAFKSRCTKDNYRTFRAKVKTYKRSGKSNFTHSIVHNVSESFTTKDVIAKLGANPVCYLTGKKIDLNQPHTFQFDHIIPTSKGGTNDLDNLAICVSEANFAKGDLNLNELYSLCEDILNWRNKKNKKK